MSSGGVIADRYALALFEVASEKNVVDTVEQELFLIREVLEQNPDFVKFLEHPQIAKETKKQEIAKIFEGKISDIVFNFISLLIDKNREDILGFVPQYFVSRANVARGIVDALVTSVRELTEQEKQGISESFGKMLNKKVRMKNAVDPSIIGGVIVQIGDRLYDGSIAGKLERLEHTLR